MTTDPDRLIYQIAFSSLRGINFVLAEEFLMRLGSEKEFFDAREQSLMSLTGGITSRLFDRSYRDSLVEEARREVDFILANDVRALYHTDPEYPSRLREAVDAPLMIYTLGPANLNAGIAIAIVGTRHATAYGQAFVDKLISGLASSLNEKPLIVSGLAFGIDISAHRAAIREGFPTAGVLAHGLKTLYPSQHRQTAASMARDSGILVTEYLSSAPIHRGNFLARNRIVAALTDCTIVVESAKTGGALVTARLADSYSRDVFAVPGRLGDKYSAGCNSLISSATAHLLTGADDLIDAMRWLRRPESETQPELFPELAPADRAIIDHLTQRGEARAGEIAIAVGKPVGKVMAALVDLEFKGLVTSFPGGLYRPS